MTTQMPLQQIPFHTIDGQTRTLADDAGQVILIVNVASKCGLTPQYEGLEKLYRDKHAAGLQIIGFPANNFLEQEPGSNSEIAQFCSLEYGVTFPLMEKISVAGDDTHPLYQQLCALQPQRIGEGPWMQDLIEYGLTPNEPPAILWNFEKFLIGRNGKVIARFAPDVTADDSRLRDTIDQALAIPAF